MGEAPRALNLSRIENLTDGVFGFAMTLMVLGFGVEEAYRLLEAGDMRAGLATMAPRFLTLAFGVFGLGALWVAHVAQYRFVERTDANLAYLNLLALIFIIVFPFSIALWGRRWEDPRVILIMVSNLAAFNAALWLQWVYIVRQHAREGRPIHERLRRKARRSFVIPFVLWAFASALAFVHPVASVVLFVGSTLGYAVPGVARWLSAPSR